MIVVSAQGGRRRRGGGGKARGSYRDTRALCFANHHMMLLVLEPTLLSQLTGGGDVGDVLEGTGILLDVITV